MTIFALGAVFAAAGSLAMGFATYVDSVWSLPPALLVPIGFILVLAVVQCGGLVGVGLVLFAAEKAFGSRTRPPGAPPSTADPTGGA